MLIPSKAINETRHQRRHFKGNRQRPFKELSETAGLSRDSKGHRHARRGTADGNSARKPADCREDYQELQKRSQDIDAPDNNGRAEHTRRTLGAQRLRFRVGNPRAGINTADPSTDKQKWNDNVKY